MSRALAWLVASVLVASCGLLPAPEQPAARLPVGPWVAFSRQPAVDEPELGAYLAARQTALRALADHRAVGLSEPTDAALVPGLLWIDDQGGARVYQVTGVAEPPDAWVLAFRVPPPSDNAAPEEALVVVAAESGVVLLVHGESLPTGS